MNKPLIYRRRLIPDECILLKDDIILSYNENVILTKWNTLKPRKDIHHGYSCYYLNEGFKISKFLKEDGSLIYWYCDIIESAYHSETNELIVTDLLADVIIYPDGFVKVVDLDELSIALRDKIITQEQLMSSLTILDHLLTLIYGYSFHTFKKPMEHLI